MPEQFGSYTVYEEIGVGGMASVHVAESKTFGRVALKRLHEYAATEPDTVRAFLDEARLVVHLKHPNIARTYEAGKVGDTYFIAMEYVPGHTLAQLIDRCAKTIGVMPFPITVNILIQICDALDYAHSLNDELGKPLKIIHRDVSPSNVILSSTGIAKLIDFGIAKATSSTVHSQVGVVKGKFGYMAPEYLKGKLDHRVDLWALGTLAHELLTNRHLFEGNDDFKVLYNVKYAEIDPPSKINADVPQDFDVIVMTALQRDPDRRWQSASAMRTALVNAANELQTTVTNAQLIEWVHWTFTQAPPKAGSELSQLIKLFERPSQQRLRRPSSEYDLSFETSETDPFARESKKNLSRDSRPVAIANASVELLTTAPFERKGNEATPTPKPFGRRESEPAVTTPFRKGSEPALTKPFDREGTPPPKKITPPPFDAAAPSFETKTPPPSFETKTPPPSFETKTPPKPLARITPVSIPSEAAKKGTPAAAATKPRTPDPDGAPSAKPRTPDPDRAPATKPRTPDPDGAPSAKPRTPDPDRAPSTKPPRTPDPDRVPVAATTKPATRTTPSPDEALASSLSRKGDYEQNESSRILVEVPATTTKRPTPLPLSPEPTRRPTPARLQSEPPLRPTPVSFDDLPKLEQTDTRDAAGASSIADDVDRPDSSEAETRADKPLPAMPALSRSSTTQHRSRLRPWLLFFLLLAVVFAVWNYGYMPEEITDFLGIQSSGPIELDF